MATGDVIRDTDIGSVTAWGYATNQPASEQQAYNNHQNSIDINAIAQQQATREQEIKYAAMALSLSNSKDDVKEMKDNLQSLIDSCEDDVCMEGSLCMKCQLISSWIKPEPEEESNG